MELKVGNVPVRVVLKDIRHMHLYVRPPDGRVLVTAPRDVTEQAALFFVRENFGWVLRQREGMMAQRRQTPREYVSGETHYVWGEQYFLDVQKQRAWGGIRLSGDTMVMLAPEESTVRSRGECMQQWYRRLLAGEIRLRLPLWERRTGIRVDRFDILNMNRSWGKCNTDKGKIVFNLQLARKPKEGLDYVILHELCHFRHRNHGMEFVALLDRFMPNWRQARAKLNEAPLDFVLEDALDPRGSAKESEGNPPPIAGNSTHPYTEE